jgi:ABC-2 type transport system ATP-binding protein
MNIIEVKELSKSYKDNKAVDNISFNVEQGRIYGILGPNGAGKSTTIKMLAGLLSQDSGTIVYEGDSTIEKWSKNIGLVPQNIAIYDELTAKENISFFVSLYGITGKEKEERIAQTLKFVGLEDVKDKPAKEYSGGMKRRLNIACAIVHAPKLIIMDEPTVGIDPQSRNYILESVKNLNKHGTSVIYTSHYMEEVEAICDRIIILDKGHIILNDEKDNIKKMFLDKQTLTIIAKDTIADPAALKAVIGAIQGVESVSVEETKCVCVYEQKHRPLDSIIQAVYKSGIEISDISTSGRDLETIFLALTGKELRE